MDKLKEIVNTVLKNRQKAAIEDLTEEMSLRNDIGMDSLDLAELTVRIEAEYDVDVFSDGIVDTIGEIMSKIKSNGKG